MSVAETAPFEHVLSAAGPEVRELMDDVERRLAETATAYGRRLGQAAGETLAAGGKRLRPLLVFVCGHGAAADESRKDSLARAGVAVELVHMATLVHDDVLDKAALRRGQPTVFASLGRGAATATGDLLFSRAFGLLDGVARRDQVRALAEASLALARGELAQRNDAYAPIVSVDRYLARCELKTASLFVAACRLGSLAAGHGQPHTEALGCFGERVGLAFQLLDDVLDVAGSPVQTGKERGNDLLDGTVTLPLILAAETDRELAALDLRSLTSREDAERICDRIAATGALDETRGRARALVIAAKSELGGELDPDVAELLRLVADGVVARYS